MSPGMKTTLRVLESNQKQIEKLKHRAIQLSDPVAALALADLAIAATKATQDLWFESSNVKGKGPDQSARREMLLFWLGNKPIPILHPVDPRGQEILDSFQFGPYKKRNRKNTDMKKLLDLLIYPEFQAIQHSVSRPSGLDGQIWDLPPLASSPQKWADVIVAWLWDRYGKIIVNPASTLYKIARPEHGLAIDAKRRRMTLKIRGKKRLLKGGGEMSEIGETWTIHEQRKIDKMRVTDAHIRNGLKAAIVGFLTRNLR